MKIHTLFTTIDNYYFLYYFNRLIHVFKVDLANCRRLEVGARGLLAASLTGANLHPQRYVFSYQVRLFNFFTFFILIIVHSVGSGCAVSTNVSIPLRIGKTVETFFERSRSSCKWPTNVSTLFNERKLIDGIKGSKLRGKRIDKSLFQKSTIISIPWNQC